MNEYAKAGVDPNKVRVFERVMKGIAQRTRYFPESRKVMVTQMAHSAGFQYVGSKKHSWGTTKEGLGNKNWLAEWMYKFGDMKPHYQEIGIDVVLMAANDVITSGALPVLIMDEVSAGDSDWFLDEARARDLGEGFYSVAKTIGAAPGGGESASLRYLVNPLPPVYSAPVMSASVVGIICPTQRMIFDDVRPGDVIMGASSSGMHANGFTLAFNKALTLPDKFMGKLPSGKIIGEELLTPTRSYVGLVEALLDDSVHVSALMPGTGDGVSKICKLGRFTYRIHSWVAVKEIFFFMREKFGIPIKDCLTTFNWGIGYYIFVRAGGVYRATEAARRAGFELIEIGDVREGDHQVIFGPENDLILEPPHE